MEKLRLEYPAGAPAQGRALVGVVGSGDLEVLIEPGAPGLSVIEISSSVDGSGPVWRAQLDRLFGTSPGPAVHIEINDFGATPGVVSLRLSQALEEIAP